MYGPTLQNNIYSIAINRRKSSKFFFSVGYGMYFGNGRTEL